ncbi:MAG: hypothetical protein K6E58_00655 [Eubacterium sp.]|nr:hypothetical protein [Eubacterium sp.]
MGDHFYWNSAKLSSIAYGQTLTEGKEYTATISVSYTSGEAESGKTPELLYNLPVAGASEATMTLSEGTNTINVPAFTYDASADNSLELELDSLEKESIIQVTGITFTETGWTEVPKNTDFVPSKDGISTPWTLRAINDQSVPGEESWGDLQYSIDGNPAAIGSTKIKVVNPGGENEWNFAILKDYAKNNMRVNHSYTCTVVYDYDDDGTGKSGAAGDELALVVDNNKYTIDVGSTPSGTYTSGKFEYTGDDDDVTFFLDGLKKGSELSVSSVTFTSQDGNFENVPNDTDFTPEDGEGNPTPWTLRAVNNPATDQYGQLMYQVDGSPASDIGSTYINLKNTVGEQETDEHGDPVTPENRWWWASASLMDYNANLEPWMTYTGEITLNISAPTAENAKLYIYIDGEEYGFPLTQGDNTIEIPAFIFKGASNGGSDDVKFLLDELPKEANLRITGVSFEKDGNWVAVPDNRPGTNQFEITGVPFSYQFRNVDGTMGRTVSGTRDWQIFAGIWQGSGAVLYYDPDFAAAGQPKVRIGAGERWDPACAQIKLPNPTQAYKELQDYTSYYLTYEFTSTQMGTVHITHEGYEPNRPERIDITADMYDETDGLYHVKYEKKFTRNPTTDYKPDGEASYEGEPNNLFLSLTATTYVDGGAVVEDGTPLPLGTELGNFKVEYQRTDEDVYTLVNDCRFEGHQDYTPIVTNSTLNKGVLLGYTNSYFDGWMSYKNNVYTAGEDDIAKASIRLDSTNGDFGPTTDTRWAEHLRIPNDYFYGNRDAGGNITQVGRDTNGNPLKDGDSYKLRFYYNVDLSEAEGPIGQGKGMVLVQQGFGDPTRYPTHSGLNMANGSINTKGGYNSHSDEDYDKDGGIDFTYDDDYRTIDPTIPGNEYLGHVQFDFSDLPAGTKITDISWEFYAPKYNIYIDNVLDGSVTEYYDEQQGVDQRTYTFPEEEGVIGYRGPNGHVYDPGDTVSFDDLDATGEDLYVTTIRNIVAKVVDKTDHSIEYDKDDTIVSGGSYTVPDISGIASYELEDGTPVTVGQTFTNLTSDLTIYATRAQGTHTVTIKDKNNQETIGTFTVAQGDGFTFPTNSDTGYEHVATFVGVSPTTGTYLPGDNIDVNDDLVYKVTIRQHTVTINDTVVATQDEGTTYTFPTNDDPGYEHVAHFTDGENTYLPGDSITLDDDVVVTAVLRQHTVTIKDKNNEQTIGTYTRDEGATFTFPTNDVPGYEHVATYEGVAPTTGSYEPNDTVTVNTDLTYKVTIRQHTVTINDTVVATQDEGTTYTFPTNDDPGYEHVDYFTDGEHTYQPGDPITLNDDVVVTAVTRQHTVTIRDKDNDQVIGTYTRDEGATFTFPTNDVPGYEHVATYEGVAPTTGSYEPNDTVTVNTDLTYKVTIRQHTVTIKDKNNEQTIGTYTQDEGTNFTFPTNDVPGYEHVASYEGVAPTTGSYEPNDTVAVNTDLTYKVTIRQHTVTIDNTVVATQDEGTTYTFPTNDDPGYEHVDYFTDGEHTYQPGDPITLNDDVVVTAVQRTYKVYIDGTFTGETVVEGDSYTTPTDVPEGTKFKDTATEIEYNPGDSVPNIVADLYLETVSPAPKYTWTVDGENPQQVSPGTTITLPSTAQVGYLLEYVDGDDKGITDDLYHPGSTYVVNRNVNFISINSVTLEQRDAASMYYKKGTDMRGIRFLAKLSVNGESDKDILSSDAFETGMLMTTYDIYTEYFDEELDLDTYAAAVESGHADYAYNVTNVTDKTKKWIAGMDPGYFSCGIINIKDENITREMVARGYVKVKFADDKGSTEEMVNYGTTTHPFSIQYVAQGVYKDTETYNNLPEWKKTIVDDCRNYQG